VVPGVGHNMPQEVPQVFAAAVLSLVAAARCRRATAPT
jgi:pimeloyl-ACP methyl ester carboxylesterase